MHILNLQNLYLYVALQVLKTHDLIDVQQEEPYGDISFKLTPALAKAKI